jgi:hypothetical protein
MVPSRSGSAGCRSSDYLARIELTPVCRRSLRLLCNSLEQRVPCTRGPLPPNQRTCHCRLWRKYRDSRRVGGLGNARFQMSTHGEFEGAVDVSITVDSISFEASLRNARQASTCFSTNGDVAVCTHGLVSHHGIQQYLGTIIGRNNRR